MFFHEGPQDKAEHDRSVTGTSRGVASAASTGRR